MIEFITLLLGLSRGPHPVAVAVTAPVVAVVLELDGQIVGRRDQPPWSFEVDLGPELQPRRLVAIAFDAEGHELGRAQQFVNYHRRNEDATVFLEATPDAGETRGRVVWRSFRDRRPKKVELQLDDVEVELAADGSFTLPAHDPELPHYLVAIVKFAGEEELRRELVFGGLYGDRVTSALTAVPVLVRGEHALPPAAELTGWLEARGKPLRVLSVEKPGAIVTVIRDRAARKPLDRLERELRRQRLQPAAVLTPETETFFIRTHSIPEDPRIFQSVPAAVLLAGPARPAPVTDDRTFDQRRQGLLWATAGFTPEPPPAVDELFDLVRINTAISQKKQPQRLTEALAVAGQLASSRERPRAALLLVGSEPEDQSQHSLASVRRFLAALRVPCFVWAPAPASLAALEPGNGDGLYFGAEGLVDAFAAMDASLRGQHVVWVEGDFLPQDVALGSNAPVWLGLAE